MNIIPALIEREKYLDYISPFIGKNLIKVLTGQRRVGKSYVLMQCRDYVLNNDKSANVIFLNMENMENRHLSDDETLYQYIKSHIDTKRQNYLFIDEVQNVRNFENVLRSFQSTGECDIFVTGSNAKMLSGDLATYLAGRYVEFRIHPLSYSEFLTFHNRTDSDESVLAYLEFGGLPQLAAFPLNEALAFAYLRDVHSTILLKDVVEREKIRDVTFLENLSYFLSDNIGSLFSANKIYEYLKSQRMEVTNSVVLNHLRALCNAFIVNKVRRYDIQGKKIFETNEKYYFEDTGLRNSLCGYSQNRDIGKLIENVVYLHLARCGFEVFVGKLHDKEVDFVARKRDRIVYVQAAYLIYEQNTENREFGNLLAIRDNFPKYVVSLNPLLTESNTAGISYLHLRNFLLREDF